MTKPKEGKIKVFCPKCNKDVVVEYDFNCEDNHYSEMTYDHTGRIVLFCKKHGKLFEIDEFDGII